MTLDFQKEDGRKNYLVTKLDDLLAGINATYGQALLDELVRRLENTIKDFDDEVGELMLQLKDNLEKKQQMLQELKVKKTEPSVPAQPETANPEISDWERRLEALG